MEYKITEEHFEIFKTEVEKWIDILGLQEWELSIRFDNIEGQPLAQVRYDVEARDATILLGKSWNREPTNYEIKDAAQHEVLELMLGELYPYYGRGFPEWMINTAIHNIVQKILNTIRKGKLKVT
jgi:hypothetical protein